MAKHIDIRVVPRVLWFQSSIRLLIAMGLIGLLASSLAASDQQVSGKKIYQEQCAECHGAKGQGVDEHYSEPIGGQQSLEQLFEIIDGTMPEDDPERCEAEHARRVAKYIFDTFYNASQRAKIEHPSVALARLTVRQYKNTVTDLLARFAGDRSPDKQRGLQGRYYKAKNFRGDKKVFQRVDSRVAFDFGESSPDADKIGKAEFSIQWQGGIIAEDTGDYTFCVKTENGAKLWINDKTKPLVDAWVRSGDQTEHSATIRLLGGRAYYLRLDYFKFKEKTASISLQWQPPHKAREIIPERNLSPVGFPWRLVVDTEFPPDDSSVGYERGTSVSKSWDQATTYAAIEVANKVVARLVLLSGCKENDPKRQARLKDFCYRFVSLAFRRQLSAEQKQFFVDRQFKQSADLSSAVKRVVLLALKSPRFLYPGIRSGAPDDYDVASRIALGLWDSLPDSVLWQAASQGKLRTAEQVARQAKRMVRDPRTRAKLRYFLHHWLDYDRAENLAKDKKLFPEFDSVLASDLRTSLDLFLDDVIWSGDGDCRNLLLSDAMFVNKPLARFYDIQVPVADDFVKVTCDPAKRAGVLTHPFLMATFAYHKSSSPIHRGVFVVRSLVGRALKPPPIAVAPLDEGLDSKMTTRERVALQTKPAACNTCHALINPLGFSFEHYDAMGRYREREKDRPIDASGAYRTLAGKRVTFTGARQLAEYLARSDEVHRTFVEQLFHSVVKQPLAAYGPKTLEELTKSFEETDFNVQKLLVTIINKTVFWKPGNRG